MNDQLIKLAKEYIHELFKGESTGHDEEHIYRVYHLSIEIMKGYPNSNPLYISLAALLHDADDPKIFNTKDNKNAREFLHNKVNKVDEDKIIEIINEISFSKNKDKKPSSIEAMIVQDADRLDAIGAIGIARTFAYGGKNNRPLSSSINHFHEKLLLIKDKLNTDEAKRIANHRHQILLDFLKEYEKETRY